MSERPIKRHVLPRSWRTGLRVIVTGVVLALVVIAVGIVSNILSQGRGAQAPSAPAGRAATDYMAGMSALSAGETTRAVTLLQRAAAEGSSDASRQLAATRRSTTPATAPSGGATQAPASFTSGVADIAQLLPATVSGYRMAQIETDTASAIVSGEPVDRAVRLTIQRADLTVFDKRTPDAASKWVRSLGSAFPKAPADVKVGDLTGRFGTDGARLAAVAFSRGRFAFEVVLTVRRGDPSAARAAALQIAASFAAAHASQGQ